MELYDTKARRKRSFEPQDPKAVSLYVCGPTVYDDIHIGNARPLIVFDVLYRLLRRIYGVEAVTYVRNITDIDDKIIERAKHNKESIGALTERTIVNFHKVVHALGVLRPDYEPLATQHIPQMIKIIEKLLENNYAYIQEGHVLFSVPSMVNYGEFAGVDIGSLEVGSRISVESYKKDATDFILWKPSPKGVPGWESPWGFGRPGWHIECSAMSKEYLGLDFDIHGGGIDLVFPHHQNEIAQTCCAYPQAGFAHYWMHNGYVMCNGQKMSKSLGNFYTVEDLLRKYPSEVIRLVLLQAHYRRPLDFSISKFEEAWKTLNGLYGVLQNSQCDNAFSSSEKTSPVLKALEDDLNTPKALAELFGLIKNLKMVTSSKDKAYYKGMVLEGASLLGILQTDPKSWFALLVTEESLLSKEKIEDLLLQREEAKIQKNYEHADRIRQQLDDGNILLKDRPDGSTVWFIKGR